MVTGGEIPLFKKKYLRMHYILKKEKKKETRQHLQHTAPLDNELLCRVKQVAMNNPFINNLQVRPDCLCPQRK